MKSRSALEVFVIGAIHTFPVLWLPLASMHRGRKKQPYFRDSFDRTVLDFHFEWISIAREESPYVTRRSLARHSANSRGTGFMRPADSSHDFLTRRPRLRSAASRSKKEPTTKRPGKRHVPTLRDLNSRSPCGPVPCSSRGLSNGHEIKYTWSSREEVRFNNNAMRRIVRLQ